MTKLALTDDELHVMTDAELDAWRQQRVDEETTTIKQLEAVSTTGMTTSDYVIHGTKIRDAYWRRRMATRTRDEMLRKVCAP